MCAGMAQALKGVLGLGERPPQLVGLGGRFLVKLQRALSILICWIREIQDNGSAARKSERHDPCGPQPMPMTLSI